jgi:hypothetical protein
MYAERTAKLCLFSRHWFELDGSVRDDALDLAHSAVSSAHDEDEPVLLPFAQLAAGMAEYRNGQWAAAIAQLQASATAIPDNVGGWQRMIKAADCFFLAMAYWQCNELDQARYWFIVGSEKIEDLPPSTHINDWIVAQTAREEAEELIYGRTPQP